jgi:hypothetical protein
MKTVPTQSLIYQSATVLMMAFTQRAKLGVPAQVMGFAYAMKVTRESQIGSTLMVSIVILIKEFAV